MSQTQNLFWHRPLPTLAATKLCIMVNGHVPFTCYTRSFTIVATHHYHPKHNSTWHWAATFILQEDELTAAAPPNPCTPTPINRYTPTPPSSIRPLCAAGWEWLYAIRLEMTKGQNQCHLSILFFVNKFCKLLSGLKIRISTQVKLKL